MRYLRYIACDMGKRARARGSATRPKIKNTQIFIAREGSGGLMPQGSVECVKWSQERCKMTRGDIHKQLLTTQTANIRPNLLRLASLSSTTQSVCTSNFPRYIRSV